MRSNTHAFLGKKPTVGGGLDWCGKRWPSVGLVLLLEQPIGARSVKLGFVELAVAVLVRRLEGFAVVGGSQTAVVLAFS